MRIFKQETIESHPRQQFQVERIAFFSDAVFAIVITLLVIEFKAPHLTKDSTIQNLQHEFQHLRYNFIAIIISFFVVASQWRLHHFLFKYIHNYTDRVVKLSLLILFPIIFFPFTTSFFAETAITQNEAIAILGMKLYMLNIFAATLSVMIFYYFVFIENKRITYNIPVDKKSKFLSKLLFTFLISLIGFISTMISKNTMTIIWVLVIIIVLRALTNKLTQHLLEHRIKKNTTD